MDRHTGCAQSTEAPLVAHYSIIILPLPPIPTNTEICLTVLVIFLDGSASH
jgi:hypothetical protein